MKNKLTFFLAILSVSSLSQSVKTFNGPLPISWLIGDGTVQYSYYEDPETHEYIKHGPFSFSYKGTGDCSGFEQTVSGNFKNGLRTDTWNYTIIFTDFKESNQVLGDSYYLQDGGIKYRTGKITLTANYKDGLPSGIWKQIRTYKTRKKVNNYGILEWDTFSPDKTVTINGNFKNGKLNGELIINDEFKKFNSKGNFDENSLFIGTWYLNDIGNNENREYIFKDGLPYEIILRSNTGGVLDIAKFYDTYNNYVYALSITQQQSEEEGWVIDTILYSQLMEDNYITNIYTYMTYLFNNRLFHYEEIGGDLAYGKNFYGGYVINVNKVNYMPLSNIPQYKKYIEYIGKSDTLLAYINLLSIIDDDRIRSTIKPSEQKLALDEITKLKPRSDELLLKSKAECEYIENALKNENDSLIIFLDTIHKHFNIKIYTEFAANKNRKDDFYGNAGYYLVNTGYNAKKENKMVIKPEEELLAICVNYKKFLDYEENVVRQNEFSLNGQKMFKFSKNDFINDMSRYLERINYLKARHLFNIDTSIYQKKEIIAKKNDNNNKSALYSKYNGTYNRIYSKRNDSYDNYLKLNYLDSISDRVIYLYSDEINSRETLSKVKKDQIITLNNTNPKQILFEKYNQLFSKYYSDYENELSKFFANFEILDRIDQLSDRVTFLYSIDTKKLERKLEKTENLEEASLLLFEN